METETWSSIAMYGSPWLIIFTIIMLILKGKLVTRTSVLDIMKDRDSWKSLALELYSQNQQLLRCQKDGNVHEKNKGRL